MKITGNIVDPYTVGNVKSLANTRKIVCGSFTEGESVTVDIDGNVITRKVRWSKQDGDLYVMYKNAKYFLYEFE